jgi:tetratricopeptide (TPR) repeat protein
MLQLSKWDLDVETSDEEQYQDLVRAVRRTHQRFKLLFVSCSPSQGEKVRCDLIADIPTKKYELLDIKESIDNLYEAINNIPNLSELDVLFIRGLEYSIFEYEDQEFGDISKRSQSDVYGGSWAGVPPVLARLNMQRELFRDRLPQICFVFLLPHFAVDYFIRRAPDFYDWKSGIYRFKTDAVDLRLQANTAWDFDDYDEYENLTAEEKLSKIREVKACLDEVLDPDIRWQLLFQLAAFSQLCNLYLPTLDALNRLLQIRPNDSGILDWCGSTLNQLGRYEEAIASYDRSLALKPDKDEAWSNRGIALGYLGRYEEAIASYDRSLALKPDKDEAWSNRGIALGYLGRYEEAIASYDLSLELKPDKDAAWYNRGITLFQLGRYEEAIASYDRSLELKPDDAAWSNRGNALGYLGRYEEAIASYDRSLELKPDKDEAWWGRGIALRQLGRYEEAIASYDRCLEIKPNQDEIWYNRGIALGYLGRYEEAIASYDRSLELKPDDEAWYNRGIALGYLGRYEEAIASYDRSLELKPDDEAWYNRGIALGYLGRYEEAIASYDRSLELKSDNDAVWYCRGIALRNLDRHEEAIYSYDRSLELKPDKDEAWWGRGITLRQLGRYEEAIASYDRSLEIKPNQDEIWHNKGILFYKWGKYQDSLNAYEQAINIKPDKHESWHDKGFVLFHIGNYKEALTAWKESFKIISKLKPSDTSDLIQELLDEQLLPKFQQPAVRDILPQILTIYTTAQVLPELGVALTRNLKAIQAPTISDYTASEWLKMWQELGKPHPELALALRMLEAGIKYKQNPTDDRVFLSLPQEMRPLLREALALEP